MSESMSLLQGTLDVLVLKALEAGPLHGYGVADWIRGVTEETLQIDDGALYTALHRMERRGWLQPEWGVSPKGRRAKYYALTRDGHKHLKSGQESWRRYAEAVFKVFDAPARTT